MSGITSKKDRERRLLGLFLERSGIAATVLDDSREAPDFLIAVDGRTIGVEVTEVFIQNDGGPDNPIVAESTADRVVAEAWRLYRDRGGLPVHASFGFHTGMLRGLRRQEAAKKLAEFVAGLTLPSGRHLALKPFGDDHFPDVPELAFLNLLAVERWEMAVWTSPKAGFVMPLSASVLQEAIDKKADRLAGYRAAAPEVWLLIGITGRGPSQFFEVQADEGLKQRVVSSFDRTYFVSGFNGLVIDLTQLS